MTRSQLFKRMRLSVFWGGAFFFLILLFSSPASPASLNEGMEEGVDRLRQLYGQSLQENQARLRENPGDTGALLSLGQLYWFRADHENAIRCFRRAVESA
ncbi:MAG: hypothetical protein WC450_09140, partial [Candidatus Omnitrophota bacterium]